MAHFLLTSDYAPTGDQPRAIETLSRGLLREHRRHQTLLGVTGSGKTFTMANIIANYGRPTLVLAHNKTLAAQLYTEFREFFPQNAVHYFVSYFDYYQPEAYIASSDTYIEKDSAINEEIDRLRHGATEALLTRDDVIVVASVSCIYGIGSPIHYTAMSLVLKKQGECFYMASGGNTPETKFGQGLHFIPITQHQLITALIDMQYHRNDMAFERGNFRVKGEICDLFPASGEQGYRFEFAFDQLETIKLIDPVTGNTLENLVGAQIFPNTHYITPKDQMDTVIGQITEEYQTRRAFFEKHQKYLELQRLDQRIKYDLEMLSEIGFVKGIENYSRYLDGRKAGQAPYTLLDFFPKDYLLMIDESHMTIPQVRGMYNGDRARKETLVEYGFRLPSALDNRPLTFNEFINRTNKVIYVSATPAEYELELSGEPVHQLIRPTGLLDPIIEVRESAGQIDDLVSEIKVRIARGQRVLATTLTKRMAEDLTDYLKELNIKTAYIHADVDTLERSDILRDLRRGVYDVLVGINLLREGLDLPEVSLVAVIDADKEGFLRSKSALIQIIGRAARHEEGRVIMYADNMTESMAYAIKTTEQRRELQDNYNRQHGIIPKGIKKMVTDGLRAVIPEKIEKNKELNLKKIPPEEYQNLANELRKQMEVAAAALNFEEAARLRDQIAKINQAIDQQIIRPR